jgi:hypothetical protein
MLAADTSRNRGISTESLICIGCPTGAKDSEQKPPPLGPVVLRTDVKGASRGRDHALWQEDL